MKIALMVHCIYAGKAVCGKPGSPRDWKDYESWVSLADWEEAKKSMEKYDGAVIVCSECQRRIQKREQRRTQKREQGL